MSVLKVKENGAWKDIPAIVGEAAGFGTVTATVDTNVGTPTVVVTSSGEDTAKNFAFQFKNLGYDDSELQNDFDVLQGQFDTAVAAVTTDTEVTDIRVGADGITDTTAGASVRRQFTDVKSAIKVFTESTKNLFVINGLNTTQGGIKVTQNEDGSFHIQGTATTDVAFYKDVSYANGDYYMSLSFKSGSSLTGTLGARVRNVPPGQGSMPINVTTTSVSGTKYGKATTTPIRLDLYIANGTTINADAYIQLERDGISDFTSNVSAHDVNSEQTISEIADNVDFLASKPRESFPQNIIIGNGIANGQNLNVGETPSYSYEDNANFKHGIIDLYTITDAVAFNISAFTSFSFNFYFLCDGAMKIVEKKYLSANTGQNALVLKKPTNTNLRWLVFNIDKTNTTPSAKNLALKSIEDYTNGWNGKKIVWYGTSISACGYIGNQNPNALPQQVGYLLNANVINEAIGSSCIHSKVPRRVNASTNPYGFYENFEKVSRCLTNSQTEMQWIIDHWNTAGLWNTGTVDSMTAELEAQILANSYEAKVDPYLTESTFPDLFVFEHGYNDLWNNKAEQDGYFETYGDTEIYSYRAGMDFLIKRILDYNPRAKIVLIGNYCGNGTSGTIEGDVPAMQEQVMHDWNLPMLKQWERLGWTTLKTVDLMGYWNLSGGTWSWIDDTTSHEMTVLQAWLPDGVHPHTDSSGKAVRKLAYEIAKYLKSEVSLY